MTHRFFLPAESFLPEGVCFPAETSRQISRVLRLKVGDEVLALDNAGQVFQTRLVHVSEREVRAEVLSAAPAGGEPAVDLHLLLCLTQREKFEWMLQKCTELGVTRFTPVVSSRSLIQQPGEAERKYDRWQTILKEAAEQCGRGRVPQLLPTLRWQAALQTGGGADLRLAAWEGEKTRRLKECLAEKPARVQLLIGPEGGFAAEEIQQAEKAGFIPVSLGPRILRMETAAVVAAAWVLYELGEI